MLAVAVDKDESGDVDICLSSSDDHAVEASQLAFNEALLHSLYSHVASASVTPSPSSTQTSYFAMIVGNDLQKSESQSWHLDSAPSRHLTSKKTVFVGLFRLHLIGLLLVQPCNHASAFAVSTLGLSLPPSVVVSVLDEGRP